MTALKTTPEQRVELRAAIKRGLRMFTDEASVLLDDIDTLTALVSQLEAEQTGTKRDRDRVIMDRNREIDTLTAQLAAERAKVERLERIVTLARRYRYLHGTMGESISGDALDAALAEVRK